MHSTDAYIEVQAETFVDALDQVGLHPTEITIDGQIHRFCTNGDASYSDEASGAGWYVCHGPLAFFGDWRAHTKYIWKGTNGSAPTEEEEAELKERVEKARQDKEEKYRQEAEKAKALWSRASKVENQEDHQYLVIKQIDPVDGIRVLDNVLLIPRVPNILEVNFERDLEALLLIFPDGIKRNLGKGHDNCFPIYGDNEVILICEGIATAVSLYMATKRTVLCAFGAGNLTSVSALAALTFPHATRIVAADAGEAGIKAAGEAGRRTGAYVVVPEFLGGIKEGKDDFNDLQVSPGGGLEEIKDQISFKIAVILLSFLSGANLETKLKKTARSMGIKLGTLEQAVDLAKLERGASQAYTRFQHQKTTEADPEVYIAELKQNAQRILDLPDPLVEVDLAIERLGFGGLRGLPNLVYIGFTTRLLKRVRGGMPSHAQIVGPSSGGKNYLVDTVLHLLPEEACLTIDAGTPKTLIYTPEDLKHRIVFFSEVESLPISDSTSSLADGDSRSVAASAIRTLASEGHLSFDVVVRDPDTGSFTVEKIRKEGPTLLVTTTTKAIKGQLGTRLWEFPLIEDDEQILAVLKKQAELELHRVDFEPTELVAFQEYLQALAPWDVIIPFAHELATSIHFKGADDRIKRDHPRLLSMIKAVTILRHQHRKQADDGRWIATIEDYLTVKDRLDPFYTPSVIPGLTEDIRKVVQAVAELRSKGETNLTQDKLGKYLGWSRYKALRKAGDACYHGWLVNQQEKRRQPADLIVGDPLPEGRKLPSPQETWTKDPPKNPGPDTEDPGNPCPDTEDPEKINTSPISSQNGCTRAHAAQNAASMSAHAQTPPAHDAYDAHGTPSDIITSNTTSDATSNLTSGVGSAEPCADGEACAEPCARVNAAPELACARVQAFCNYIAGEFNLITTDSEFGIMLPTLLKSKAIALDFETTGLDPHRDRATLASLSTREHTFLVDLNKIPIERLGVLFAGGDRRLLAHNARFELEILGKAGVFIPSGKQVFDPMIGVQLIDAGLYEKKAPDGTYTLQSLVKRYLGIDLDKTLQVSNWGGELSQEQLDYAARDSKILFDLCEKVHYGLKEAGLIKTFEIEMLCLPAMAMIDLNGLPIDKEAWLENAERLKQNEAKASRALDTFFKKHQSDLDPKVLEDLLAIKKKIEKSKKKLWSSRNFKLKFLQGRGHTTDSIGKKALASLKKPDPLVDLLRTYASAQSLASHYSPEKLNKILRPTTGRGHCKFQQLGMVTGRTSSSEPNLQNIPRDPAFRRLIRASEGHKIVKVDYSHLHLRIAAMLAPDEVLLEVFQKGEDPHKVTASNISGIPYENVPTDLRHRAKAFNFGYLFGMGPDRFITEAKEQYGVTFSKDEAIAYRKKHFETYYGLNNWHRRQPKKTIETRSLWGRRRQNVWKHGDKLASPVQGIEVDGLKLAMGRLYEDREAHPEVRMIHTVHDELLFEAPADKAEDAATWIQNHMIDAMEEATDHKVPIEAEIQIADTWAKPRKN